MIFTFNKNEKKIVVCKKTDFKAHKLLERQDMEKWVEEYPEILGEELLILSTEYDQFDKTSERVDLLAIDKDGMLVIIELKRDDSGKYVDLQAVKYAAYCSTLTLSDVAQLYSDYLKKKSKTVNADQAKELILEFIDNDDFEELSDQPRIILASKEYKPEVTATVLWLRKFEMDIRCVKVTPYVIDENKLVIESSVMIPLPEAEEFQIRSERKDNSRRTLTVSQEEYIKFYKELSDGVKKDLPLRYKEPDGKSYYQLGVDISGIHFEWAFHGRPRKTFGVELHFERGDKEFNHSAVRKLARLKAELEKETGETVVIDENWTKSWARIYLLKNEGAMTEDLKKWAIEKMIAFYQVLYREIVEYHKIFQ